MDLWVRGRKLEYSCAQFSGGGRFSLSRSALFFPCRSFLSTLRRISLEVMARSPCKQAQGCHGFMVASQVDHSQPHISGCDFGHRCVTEQNRTDLIRKTSFLESHVPMLCVGHVRSVTDVGFFFSSLVSPQKPGYKRMSRAFSSQLLIYRATHLALWEPTSRSFPPRCSTREKKGRRKDGTFRGTWRNKHHFCPTFSRDISPGSTFCGNRLRNTSINHSKAKLASTKAEIREMASLSFILIQIQQRGKGRIFRVKGLEPHSH